MKLGMQLCLGPGHIVLDGDPAPPQQLLPTFRPMSIVAKRSPISATAELLYILTPSFLWSEYYTFQIWYAVQGVLAHA